MCCLVESKEDTFTRHPFYRMFKYGALASLFILMFPSAESTYELQEPFSLREFNNYGDVHFTEFEIPEMTSWVLWTFILLSNPLQSSCDDDDATAVVYLQQGGFPVFSPLNATFPPGFSPNSSYYSKVTLSSAEHSSRVVQLSIPSPSPGRWFVASFLSPTSDPDHIRPEGFSAASCKHYIRISISHQPYSSYKDEPLSIGTLHQYITEDQLGVVRYFIARHVYSYTITVTDCKVLIPRGANCSFTLFSHGDRLPAYAPDSLCDWSGNRTDCQLTVHSPLVNKWHYAGIKTRSSSTTLQITLRIDVKECSVDVSTGLCYVEEYYTDIIPDVPYTVNFVRDAPSDKIFIMDDRPYLASFVVESLVHSGGTLRYLLQVTPPLSDDRTLIYACINRNRLIVDAKEIKNCAKINNSTMNYPSKTGSVEYYVPYPQSGTYYISAIAECFNSTATGNALVTGCTGTITVYNNVTIRPCVHTKCGKYGLCYRYYSGVIHWSVCRCKAGYRGYGCTDGTFGASDAMQLLETLLLTLSNILFAVAGFWAIYRKWFSESLLYFFVLFSSSFYHACDNGTIYTLCVVDYSVLQYCDFYGSILSVWMTAMAMSEMPDKLRSFLHVVGVLGILIGTQLTLSGLWNFVIPLIIAAVILATSWIRVCKMQKGCFPKTRVWLVQLLPGIACSLTGLGLYCFVETKKNYFYVHSIWHMLMASAVILLLPRNKAIDFSSLKSLLCKLKMRRQRNEPGDEAIAGDNLSALIVPDSSNSTNPDSLESVVGQ